MSDQAIRLKIKEIIQRVPNSGPVHEYSRWTTDWNQFLALFQDPASNRVLGWEISRQAAPGIYISNAEEEVVHTYLVRGYMALKDSDQTEIMFNALIEEIRAEFRQDFTLGGLNELPRGFEVRTIDERMFGTTLCHYCEIAIPVQEVQS